MAAKKRGRGRPAIGERADVRLAAKHISELDNCLRDLLADWPASREPPKQADAIRLAIERSARLRWAT